MRQSHSATHMRTRSVRTSPSSGALPLPDSLRAVFVLKEIEGYSHVEVGSLLGISAGASEVRLCRAIKSLRHHLREVA